MYLGPIRIHGGMGICKAAASLPYIWVSAHDDTNETLPAQFLSMEKLCEFKSHRAMQDLIHTFAFDPHQKNGWKLHARLNPIMFLRSERNERWRVWRRHLFVSRFEARLGPLHSKLPLPLPRARVHYKLQSREWCKQSKCHDRGEQ